MVGYSGTPLVTKLGIKPGHRVLLTSAPSDFALDGVPVDAQVVRRATGGPFDVVLLFCRRARDLDSGFDRAVERTPANGAVWVCWPKKASGLAIDLDENGVRDLALTQGLVDVKVCAVDEVWSALKIVRRLEDR